MGWPELRVATTQPDNVGSLPLEANCSGGAQAGVCPGPMAALPHRWR
jgi:hypothetical protein